MKENPEAQLRTKPHPWGVTMSLTTNGTLWTTFFADRAMLEKLHAYTTRALENWDVLNHQSKAAAQYGERWANGWAQNFEEDRE